MDRRRQNLQANRYRYDLNDQPLGNNANRISTIDSGRGTLETIDQSTGTDSSTTSIIDTRTPSHRLDEDDDDDESDNDEPLKDPQEIKVEHMALCANRSYDHAFVSHVDNPSAFFVQLSLPKGQFEDLQLKINSFYSNQSKNRNKWKRGQYCVAKFDVDQQFYRARIVEPVKQRFESNENPTIYTVVYIDFGNRADVALRNIHCLERDFVHLRAQAIPCSLSETLPRTDSWSNHSTAMRIFQKLVDQQFVDLIVKPKSSRDVWQLNFVEIIHSETQTNIRDRLKEANEMRSVSNEEIYYAFGPKLTQADLIVYNIEHEYDEN